MGRARKPENLELPRYMARKGDSYYFVSRGARRWIPLGQDLSEAIAQHRMMLRSLGHPTAQPLLPEGYSARSILTLVRRSARSRGLENALSEHDVAIIVRRAGGRCEVSGIAFNGEREPGQRIRVYAPSMDRIDSAMGYTFGNCRLVCAGVNVALNRFGEGLLAAMRGVARAGIVEDSSTIPSDVENQPTQESHVSR